ncbi:MAG: polysaccharide deacetylase family protein [bacterium]|nr:polysaccharide deacetylase family protein [bacterium]
MERRNSFIFRINIIFVVIIVILIGINVYLKSNNLKLKNLSSDTFNTLEEKNKELENVTKNNDSIVKEINYYNNIDIKEIKEEYFKNIKLLESSILDGTNNSKIAYLTFDDGPYDLTSGVLDILLKYDVRATFFVLGKPSYLDTYKRINNEGHSIGNHTYYHNIFTGLYASATSFMENVVKLEDYLYTNIGVKTNILRFPGGIRSSGSKKEEIVEKLRSRGYGYVDWTAETGDGNTPGLTSELALSKLKRSIFGQKVAVVLMHDYSNATYSALPTIIEDLQNQGYILLPLFKDSVMIKK